MIVSRQSDGGWLRVFNLQRVITEYPHSWFDFICSCISIRLDSSGTLHPIKVGRKVVLRLLSCLVDSDHGSSYPIEARLSETALTLQGMSA